MRLAPQRGLRPGGQAGFVLFLSLCGPGGRLTFRHRAAKDEPVAKKVKKDVAAAEPKKEKKAHKSEKKDKKVRSFGAGFPGRQWLVRTHGSPDQTRQKKKHDSDDSESENSDALEDAEDSEEDDRASFPFPGACTEQARR